MAVEVQLSTQLRPFADGQTTLEGNGATVGEVLKDIGGRYPALEENLGISGGEIPKYVNIYLDDEDIRYLEQLETGVRDGAHLVIMPAVAGG